MRPATAPATLSGRVGDRATLLDLVRAGLAGSPQAVLVHGEAGIGKTALVRSVSEEVMDEGTQVLWGQSLRFGAAEAMYHPLVLALEGWLAEADGSDRASIVEAVPAAALILPSLGAAPVDRPSRLMTVVDALLSRVIDRGPTVVVVDDVHWADPATWDAVSYLVAGFARQRLAVLVTYRDEAAASDGFQRWSGNLRRLPGTRELALRRIDEAATANQIAVLLGRPPTSRLVDQVYERSQGNPYFSELLVRRGDLGSAELPDDLPEELSQALLDAWRGLSGDAREIARILAVSGRPRLLTELAAVAAELGLLKIDSVREAVEAGVIFLGADGAWFRHPLQAAVLVDSYLPGEASPVHAAWADRLEVAPTDGVDELRRLGDVASHRERAGDGSAAFGALLQGADLAEKLGARRETADLLARAAGLWEASADRTDEVAQARLFQRAAAACESVGRDEDSDRLFRAACDLVSSERHPLWASTLRARAAQAAAHLGGSSARPPLAEIEQLLEVSRLDPDSAEHAETLIAYARVLYWADRRLEARTVADDAIAAAERSGSATVISRAHAIRALQLFDTDLAQAERDVTICWEQASISGDPEAVSRSHIFRTHLERAKGDLREFRDRARDLFELSVKQGMEVFPSILLAGVLLDMGELVEAESIVRTGLAGTGPAIADAGIRLFAGILAARRGDVDAAHSHLARAREIRPGLEEEPICEAAGPIAEMLLADGDAAGAFDLLERVLPYNSLDPVLDDLMLHAARATADLVQQSSDQRDHIAVQRHRQRLKNLVDVRTTLTGVAFHPSGPDDTVQVAQAALFAAELARAHGLEDQVGAWREAVTACAGAGLGWEHQTGLWRLASALVESGSTGVEEAVILRGVHEFATREGAKPLQARIEELADDARISIAPPPVLSLATVPAAFAALTAREKEVLTHLMVNRTNAEVAATLFISEKTVSVHVSNLLHKTGTQSRREVAALARRLGWATSDEAV